VRVARDALELAQPPRVRRVDRDQAADRAELESRRLDDCPPLIRAHAREVPDIPVQRAGERDDGAGIEPTRREHRREGVEVRVAVRGDDRFGAHNAFIVPGPREPPQTRAMASISTSAPDGSAAISTVDLAGGL